MTFPLTRDRSRNRSEGGGAGGNNPFNQPGATLDLVFAGVVSDLPNTGPSLGLNFASQTYQIGVQYAVWETGVGLGSKAFGDIITFTRASTATFFNSSGVLTSAAIDAPRLDYNPSTLAARGLLIEEARTNLLTYSEEFDTTPDWNPIRTSVTADAAVAPDGNTTADALVIDTTPSTNHNIGQNESVTSGITYTISVFAKANQITQINVRFSAQFPAGNTLFDLSAGTLQNNGTVVASSITPVGNGWYRCTFTATANATGTATAQIFLAEGNAITIATANGTDNVLLWGAQLEVGAFPTSYIPTTTTALTRSADVASVNTLSPWYNASEGTLFAQAQDMSDAAHASAQPRAASINDGTTGNRIDISRLPAPAQSRANVFTGGASQFNSLNTAWPLSTQAKIALAYKAADFAACLGGGTVASVASGTVPTVSALTIGNVTMGGTSGWVGWIQRITYYPRRLSNADLQTITL